MKACPAISGLVQVIQGSSLISLVLPTMASCDLTGLAAEWDEIPNIRQRLREGGVLIEEVSSKNVDIQTPAKYSDVLMPILHRMRAANKKLPNIDDLRSEIAALLELSKRADDGIEKFGWLIRKNLVFIKMKVRRQEVSTATLFALHCRKLSHTTCLCRSLAS